VPLLSKGRFASTSRGLSPRFFLYAITFQLKKIKRKTHRRRLRLDQACDEREDEECVREHVPLHVAVWLLSREEKERETKNGFKSLVANNDDDDEVFLFSLSTSTTSTLKNAPKERPRTTETKPKGQMCVIVLCV